MIRLFGMLSLLLSIGSYGMQKQNEAAQWATEELQKRFADAHQRAELLSFLPEAKQQFCAKHEKNLLPMVKHLINMGANPHVWNYVRVHAVKQHYIRSKTALEFARDLKMLEITSLLESIPEHKEKIA